MTSVFRIDIVASIFAILVGLINLGAYWGLFWTPPETGAELYLRVGISVVIIVVLTIIAAIGIAILNRDTPESDEREIPDVDAVARGQLVDLHIHAGDGDPDDRLRCLFERQAELLHNENEDQPPDIAAQEAPHRGDVQRAEEAQHGAALVEHVRDDSTGDKTGYFGEAPGVPAIVPAGSVVVFSSLSFHRSGPNTTDQMRRAYVTQYSPEILRRPSETEPMHLGVPFLENGRRILTQ